MNKFHSRKLINLINEEIELFLEQSADPTATPPADPGAPPAAAGSDSEPSEDKELKDLKEISKKEETDIRKIFLRGMQDDPDIKKLISYVMAHREEKEPEKKIPDIILKVINSLIKQYGEKLTSKIPPPEPKKPDSAASGTSPQGSPGAAPAAPATAPTPPAAPVTESRVQKAIKEYLYYRNMYLRSK